MARRGTRGRGRGWRAGSGDLATVQARLGTNPQQRGPGHRRRVQSQSCLGQADRLVARALLEPERRRGRVGDRSGGLVTSGGQVRGDLGGVGVSVLKRLCEQQVRVPSVPGLACPSPRGRPGAFWFQLCGPGCASPARASPSRQSRTSWSARPLARASSAGGAGRPSSASSSRSGPCSVAGRGLRPVAAEPITVRSSSRPVNGAGPSGLPVVTPGRPAAGGGGCLCAMRWRSSCASGEGSSPASQASLSRNESNTASAPAGSPPASSARTASSTEVSRSGSRAVARPAHAPALAGSSQPSAAAAAPSKTSSSARDRQRRSRCAHSA